MDRREVLKRLAIGGVTVVGGAGLLTGPLGAAPGGVRGKPGTDPDPEPEPTPTPEPGDPIGVRLAPDSPAYVELLLFNGGRRAKARFRLDQTEAGTAHHGWQQVRCGDANTRRMYYEQMSLDYVDDPVAGALELDVKGAFPTGDRDKTGSYTFYYWHGPTDVPEGGDEALGIPGIYTDATYYEVTVTVVDGALISFSVKDQPTTPVISACPQP